ncbi:hypothetical protein KIPB_002577 [Kipferlia bialata]|uniref:Uncharacterized protein n=1 Tax=Kipferlia bialata TaxID=797122 RepID=A0A9K3GE63_9EUKA|nr:hypothetical protein KIPB_000198 [Kipferlia bialata]GIQ81596.1 hypothetical protein KIPB_002577 [Kipferlia bialata]|eukprot:g198.t1
MPRSYLKWEPETVLGMVCSGAGAVMGPTNNTAVCAAWEMGQMWNMRQGQLVKRMENTEMQEVTAVAFHAATGVAALGFHDGCIKLFSLTSEDQFPSIEATLHAHTSCITHLAFNGDRLVSSSADTTSVLWDTLTMSALIRVRAHSAPVNASALVRSKGRQCIVSGGGDKVLRVFDLTTQTCIQSSALNDVIVGVAAVENEWSAAVVRRLAERAKERDLGDAERVALGQILKGGIIAGTFTSLVLVAVKGEAVLRLYGTAETVLLSGAPLQGDVSAEVVPAETETASVDGTELAADLAAPSVSQCLYLIGTVDIPFPVSGVSAGPAVGASGAPKEGKDVSMVTSLSLSDNVAKVAVWGKRRCISGTVRNMASAMKQHKRRTKRREKKERKAAGDEDVAVAVPFLGTDVVAMRGQSWLHKARVTRADPRGTDVLVSLANNSAILHRVRETGGEEEGETVEKENRYALAGPGHRESITCLDISAQADVVLTVSPGRALLHRSTTSRPIATVTCVSSKPRCAVLLPGNTHCVIGTAGGVLEVVDMVNGRVCERLRGHKGSVTGLALGDGEVVSVGSDHMIRVWRLEMVEGDMLSESEHSDSEDESEEAEQETGGPRLGLLLDRSADMGDAVSCVCMHGARIYAALLDSSVRVVHSDTLKPVFTLYGHHLPVRDISVSADGELVATGSADKTLRIWGGAFGDCHRAMRGHDGPVTGVHFVRDTHHVMTCGQDGQVVFWDADTWARVQTLSTPAPLSCLAGAKRAVVAAGQGRDIRVYFQTDEATFLADEERRQVDAALAAGERQGGGWDQIAEIREGATRGGVGSLDTVHVRDVGDTLRDAVHMAWQEKLGNGEAGSNPMLLGRSPAQYTLHVLRDAIPAPSLSSALRYLSLELVEPLLILMEEVLSLETAEFVGGVVASITEAFHPQLSVSCPTILSTLVARVDAFLCDYEDILLLNAGSARMGAQQLLFGDIE